MGRQRHKVDINNAPLVDVTLVMLMPSEDVYFYKYYSVSGLKQASRLIERQRRKVDINNAPLVDVTLVMAMPSDDTTT